MIVAPVALYAVAARRPRSWVWALVGYDETTYRPLLTIYGGPLTGLIRYDDQFIERVGELVTFPTPEEARAHQREIRQQIATDAAALVREIEADLRKADR